MRRIEDGGEIGVKLLSGSASRWDSRSDRNRLRTARNDGQRGGEGDGSACHALILPKSVGLDLSRALLKGVELLHCVVVLGRFEL